MIIGGAVADKFPKKNIMFYSNIVRAILVATILTWFIVGDVTLYTFALFALFFGLADAFFWSADGSILPELVEKSRLTQANSLTQMTNQASVILGPVLGGILIKFTNYETIFFDYNFITHCRDHTRSKNTIYDARATKYRQRHVYFY